MNSDYITKNRRTDMRAILPPLEFHSTLAAYKSRMQQPFRTVDVSVGNVGFCPTIRLTTDCDHLIEFFRWNFPIAGGTGIDGEIIVLNPDLHQELPPNTYESARFYEKESRTILTTNNDYYGNIKLGYRILCADLAMPKGLVTLHSAAVLVDGRLVVVTGTSGSGKTTCFTHLDKRHDGVFVWDDWGLVEAASGSAIVPQECAYHMAHKTVATMLPSFTNWEALPCESRGTDKAKFMIPLHEFRRTVQRMSERPALKIHALVILTNSRDHAPFARRVSVEEGLGAFFKPAFSHAWKCEVPFMNEHLMLSDEEVHEHKQLFTGLFRAIPRLVLANNTLRSEDRERFLEMVEQEALA